MADRFLIAPLNTGQETDLRPWLIPDDAFAELTNVYLFRGRLRKRFGSIPMNTGVAPQVQQLFTRLRINLGNTDGSGNKAGTVPGAVFAVGQLFSVGTAFFTVNATGTPANLLRSDGVVGTATYDTTTGAYVIHGATAATALFFYPATPVMGLITYEDAALNNEPVYGFDTQFAYQYNNGWSRLGTAVWTGNNSQFFWGATWRGITSDASFLFVTNNNPPDVIKYWDGAAWNNLNPVFNAAGDTITTSLIVVPFKDRLLLLNTTELISASSATFTNRCRFSQNGSPVQSDAWREDIPGKGGYIDAPTKEAITSSEFLKDRLIVFFERSTWELVYTGNEILPFRWQQINRELGAESTFSTVPFDKVIISVGNVGIHACNGANVERIDEKIPDSVFQIHNDNMGVQRVYGIRDYFAETLYWAFPSEDSSVTFPTRVLVYNYRTGSWAFNDDSITCFGYYQPQSNLTWAQATRTWAEATNTWGNAALQSKFRYIIAGNQEGFVFIVQVDTTRNAISLQINNITIGGSGVVTIYATNHNLEIDDYVVVENVLGMTGLNGNIYQVNVNSGDPNSFIIVEPNAAGTYLGGGTLARVSNINIRTKQYSFYVEEGRDVNVNKIDFYVDKTVDGQITVDAAASSSPLYVTSNVLETTPYVIYPLEYYQERLWHPIYPNIEGDCVQLRISFSDAQIRNSAIAWSDFQLHGIMFEVQPTSSRLQ